MLIKRTVLKKGEQTTKKIFEEFEVMNVKRVKIFRLLTKVMIIKQNIAFKSESKTETDNLGEDENEI